MSSPNLAGLQPAVRAAWVQAGPALRRAGISYNLTSAFRTPERQAELYQEYVDRGRTGLPAAPKGGSAHERGAALDIAIPAEQRPMALPILAKFGLVNSVPGDPVHFTLQGGAGREAQGASANGGPPVLPPVDQTTLSAARASRLAPLASPPWWLDQHQVDALRSHLGLDNAAAPAPGPPVPWWLDSGQVDQLRQSLGLDQAPTSLSLPAPALGFNPQQGLAQQVTRAVNPGALTLPSPPPGAFLPPPSFPGTLPPVAAVPPPYASLAQGLLTGVPAFPAASRVAAGYGLTPGQLLLGGS